MFGIGGSELLVILIVAFLVFGPSHLPNIAKTLGKTMGEFRRVSTEFQRTLNHEMEKEEHEERTQQAAKEAGLVRLEGKEYIVKDGDVVLFRFNV